MKDFEGQVAVITGGASGIGAATARLFAERGCKVVIADLQEELGGQVADEIGGSFVRVDVTQEDDIARAVDTAVERYGQLDCMFNNAGFGGALGPIDETSADDYDITMDVLVKGVFLGIKHAARVMKPRKSGNIVSTASLAGIMVGGASHLYNTAKAAVIQLTRSTALELADWNIRVNCVCPGVIATPLAAGLETTEEQMDAFRDAVASGQPLQRTGEPEDIAEAVAFMASDRASYMTGQAQVIDGGVGLGRPWRKQQKWITKSRPIKVYRPPNR